MCANLSLFTFRCVVRKCVTEHVIEIFDKEDDKNSSIFFVITKLVEQNMSFLIKSNHAELLRDNYYIA